MEYLARFGPVIAVTGVMVLVVRCLDHLFRTHVWRQEEKKAPDSGDKKLDYSVEKFSQDIQRTHALIREFLKSLED